MKEFEVSLMELSELCFPLIYSLYRQLILRVQDIVKVKSARFLQDIYYTNIFRACTVVLLLSLALSAEQEPGVDDVLIGLPDFCDKGKKGCVFSFPLFGAFQSTERLSSF